MKTNGNAAPYVLDAVEEIPATGKDSLAVLVQRLESATQSYLECAQVVAEAQLAQQQCLDAVTATQQAIDEWYQARHLDSPVGSHWRRAQ